MDENPVLTDEEQRVLDNRKAQLQREDDLVNAWSKVGLGRIEMPGAEPESYCKGANFPTL
ncbi:hypothetical protein IFR05_007181 [Cadophora sp. M221]|nr:hypothetical protein IFR05_007181 [Cadophora sp. M221]